MADQSSPEQKPAVQIVQDADLGASKPVPPPPERLKAQPQQHAVVKACGHKLDLRHVPTQSNCDECWYAYFSLRFDPAGVGELHKLLVEDGRSGMARILGNKFTKMFGKFLSWQLLHSLEKPEEEAQPAIEGSQLDIGTERRFS